jgi:hypothetical protein
VIVLLVMITCGLHIRVVNQIKKHNRNHFLSSCHQIKKLLFFLSPNQKASFLLHQITVITCLVLDGYHSYGLGFIRSYSQSCSSHDMRAAHTSSKKQITSRLLVTKSKSFCSFHQIKQHNRNHFFLSPIKKHNRNHFFLSSCQGTTVIISWFKNALS